MGGPLASRLSDADVDVTVWNRTRAKAEALGHGTKVAGGIADLADRDVVFTMVSSSSDLEEVVRQLLSGEQVPRFLVDCSTISIEASARPPFVGWNRGVPSGQTARASRTKE